MCSTGVSAVPRASRPSASMSRSSWRLSSRACRVVVWSCWARRAAFCFFSRASRVFCCSCRALFRSGIPLDLDGRGGAVLPAAFPSGFVSARAALSAAPPPRTRPCGPNTLFIKLSQSSLYPIAPSDCSFSDGSSIAGTVFFCKRQRRTNQIFLGRIPK